MIKCNEADMHFWESIPLEKMSASQWESLCDGCAKCCLHKLEDEDTGEVFYTDVACELLDLSSCKCSSYSDRKLKVPDCVVLTPDDVSQFDWLPKTCAYRLISEGKPLLKWHPLVSGKASSCVKKGQSVSHFAVSETFLEQSDLQDRVIRWIEI